MTNYTKTTDFAAKDSLPSGDSGKIIRGTEFETEFDNIATAVNSKSDANNPTFTGTVTIDGLTVNGNTVLGNAATDTVTVTADIASNLLPSADDTYNLGAVGAEWNDLHVDGVAYIDTIAGFATTENITFGDNDKAIFGASSDLQIFHNGSHSYVSDNGTGDLKLYGANVEIGNTSGFKNFLGQSGGASIVYYNNAAKLATTSIGVDVTGTLVSDGLTVDGASTVRAGDTTNASLQSTAGDLVLKAGGDDVIIQTGGSGGEAIQFVDNAGTLYFNANMETGDISFYEDTGTTPKFVWDASAERLGIGNSAPTTDLDVTGTIKGEAIQASAANPSLALFESDTTNLNTQLNSNFGSFRIATVSDTGGSYTQRLNVDHATGDVRFYEDTGTTAKFFWDASAERLGIGTSSPKTRLDISAGTGSAAGPELTLTNGFGALTTGDRVGAINFYTSDGSNRGPNNSAVIEAQAATSIGHDANLVFKTGVPASEGQDAVETMRIDYQGNVGIGTDSPSVSLEVDGTIKASGNGKLQITDNTEGSTFEFNVGGGGALEIYDGASERMRINSGGTVLVGKTSADSLNTVGAEVQADGQVKLASDGKYPLQLNRLTTDGEIISLRKDGSTVGTVGSNVGRFYIHGSYGAGSGLRFDNASIRPATSTGTSSDATTDLGAAAARFKDIYATNSTIQTSDRNEKQDIETLSDAEQRVAVACKGLLRKFRWKSSVADKGNDARIHFGIIAQDLQDAFTAEGLDAGRYGMFIHSTWTDEETSEKRSRMGVRYSELLSFIIAAI